MKGLRRALGLLMLAGAVLTGCGVLDFDGSNARAAAQLRRDAEEAVTQQERERTRQVELTEQGETERVQIREQAHTERMLIIAQGGGDGSGSAAGTNHNGGISGALSLGVGIGWPVLAILGALVLGFILYLGRQEA